AYQGSSSADGQKASAPDWSNTPALGFKDLDQAAYYENRREEYSGKARILSGQFVQRADFPDNTCQLTRMKMTCCAPDAIPLNAVVIAPNGESLRGAFKSGDWVEVLGEIQFRKRKTGNEYIPVLQIKRRDYIRELKTPPSDPYLQ